MIVLEFVMPVLSFVDVLVVDALTGVIMIFTRDSGVEVLAGVNVNVFAFVMTALAFVVPKS